MARPRPTSSGMKTKKKIDIIFLSITILLVSVGLFIFTSASFGFFARKGFSLQNIFFDQVVMGIFLGIIALIIALYTPLKLLHKYALHIFIASAVVTALVFAPYLGREYNGATRWLSIVGFSFQPSEILKLGVIIYFAALLPLFKNRIGTIKYALGAALGIMAIPAVILLSQPNTGTLVVIFVAVCAMLLASGMKIRHLLLLFVISVLAVGALAAVRPYAKERILTFLDSTRDPLGAGYQIQKSFIAIGSGGITGRGFGQSIQKFGSLPEPTGDSIFAVAGEEFGFIGGAGIILLFLFFGIRGLSIAKNAPDAFSGLLAVGIVILIVSQSFMNIAAMLGIAPITGVPLVFVSHGGTALLFAFIQIGILLNISKQKSAS